MSKRCQCMNFKLRPEDTEKAADSKHKLPHPGLTDSDSTLQHRDEPILH